MYQNYLNLTTDMKSKTKRKTSVNNMNHAHTNNACHQIQRKWHPDKEMPNINYDF